MKLLANENFPYLIPAFVAFPENAYLKKQTGLYLDNPNPVLEFLLDLNLKVAKKEANKEPVQGPGLPSFIKDKNLYVTEDFVKWEG